MAGTEVGVGERAAGPYGPVAHEQDGRPVRPDRDSPAAPEDRHQPVDTERLTAPLAVAR
ncbi:hypothetical protein O7634_02450 [Micromonospora sp. WMMD1120]|uniref:hypothetical protein n=1 Tax=Micromonospora sp. WMMD1120 TaxID=3016106 RepID=UPI002416C9DF|nr:hypothetical protein [Micromonospora sp. WMMD1120]MDG4805617.1 hypothetical protein [Micromonospora sp. WMMD1120]